jgi:glyoxylase-like metal-dependent hydrolase (beta-lactamase superfamily II)
MIRVGRFELYSVVTGTFRLDGGAMFGVVPRVLWSNVTEPDELNRIQLTTRTLVALDRNEPRLILVDTGCGTKWEPFRAERFAIRHDAEAIDRFLKEMGLGRGDVTDVVVTHLHFDHNGGLTDWLDKPGGKTILRYPQARHWIHVDHLAYVHRGAHPRDRASFLPQDFEALDEAATLRMLEGDSPKPTIDSVEWFVSHGHTPYQLLPLFIGDEASLMFVGDVVPTSHHLAPAWVMAYDMQPGATVDEKLLIYGRCVHNGLMLAFPHDPALGAVSLGGSTDKPKIEQTFWTEEDRQAGPR